MFKTCWTFELVGPVLAHICIYYLSLSDWVSLCSGLQTPTLYLSNLTPYESEEFSATCSAPEEKGSLKFTFYQRFLSREPKIVKQLQTTGNSSVTMLKFRHIGEIFLYCSYKISLVSGTRHSNNSEELQVIVGGDQSKGKLSVCAQIHE